MDDLSTLTGQPQTLKVAGKEYKVYPLTLADFGKLQAWVDAQSPNPLAEVKRAIALGDFPFAQQKYMLELAMEKATKVKPKIGQPEADELLVTMEGYKQIILLSIRKGNPSFSEAEAQELFEKMSVADIAQLQSATNMDMVVSPNPKDDRPEDPPLEIFAVPPTKPKTPMEKKDRPKNPLAGGKSTTKR